jgi:hypothetical protein
VSLKQLVNDKSVYEPFLEFVDSKIAYAHKQLEQATTIEEVFRYQGEIRSLRRFKMMREEVNGPK